MERRGKEGGSRTESLDVRLLIKVVKAQRVFDFATRGADGALLVDKAATDKESKWVSLRDAGKAEVQISRNFSPVLW